MLNNKINGILERVNYSEILKSFIHTSVAFMMSVLLSIVDTNIPEGLTKVEKIFCYTILFFGVEVIVHLTFRVVNNVVQDFYKTDEPLKGRMLSFLTQMLVVIFIFGVFIYHML